MCFHPWDGILKQGLTRDFIDTTIVDAVCHDLSSERVQDPGYPTIPEWMQLTSKQIYAQKTIDQVANKGSPRRLMVLKLMWLPDSNILLDCPAVCENRRGGPGWTLA